MPKTGDAWPPERHGKESWLTAKIRSEFPVCISGGAGSFSAPF